VIRRVFPPLVLFSVLLAGCGAGSSSTHSTASLGAKSLSAIKPPAFVPGPLDGKSTARNLALRRSLAVILENYAPDSRPQAGLAAASTVIETLAESGITRFMALYLENDATKVGPVRSTRMYFDHWAAGFHSILAHVGGNDDAQALLWHLPSVFNVDENRWERSLYDTGTPLYWRSADRAAPHNMYTSTYKLRQYASQQKQNWVYTQASFPHKQAAPVGQRGHSGSISITFVDPLLSGANTDAARSDYAVRYTYDRRSNTYLRFMGGGPHVDANTQRPLTPSNVIVMQTQNAVLDTQAGPTPESILIPTLGSGTAWYFRDGTAVKGTWHQRDQNAPLHFVDSRGRPIALNPGQTWIEVVPASSRVGWQFR
jgi:hypothetical protein